MLKLTVNGKAYELEEIPGEKLSTLLRERLGLTGTKIGCGEGVCGICTVILNGRATRACVTPAAKANNGTVLTVEGLHELRPEHLHAHREDLRALHPLQHAFVVHGAIQCGFCTPGQLMQAFALLQANPNPSREEIQNAMKPVLCRCGSYESIISAVQAAALALRENISLPDRDVSLGEQDLIHVGKPYYRPDAIAKAMGSAKFTDDLSFEGMLFARVLRAKMPSGVLKSIDFEEASKIPGVKAVLTAKDLKYAKKHGIYLADWPILVGIGEHVRYMGDAIALVAAETQAIADEAVDKIHFELEPLAVVANPSRALETDAPLVHESGNLLKHIHTSKGDVEKAFESAQTVLTASFSTPFMEHLFMEPECSIAVPRPDGGLDLYNGSQIPFEDRRQVAEAIGLPEDKVRVRGQRTGGAFGGKEDIAGQIHAALLAMATNRPVKLLFTRRESMLVHPKRHATQIELKLAASQDGLLQAVQSAIHGDTGAYASLGVPVLTRATTHSCGPYITPNAQADCWATYTNNPPAGAFRGFGVMQVAFAIESAMDMLAEKLDIDPLQYRKINALREGTETNTGHLLEESVGLLDCLEAIEAEFDKRAIQNPFKPTVEKVDGKDWLSAWGIAAGYKNSGLGTGAQDHGAAIATLLPHGRIQIKTGAAEVGQGMLSILQLIGAEVMGILVDNINVYVMDTELTPDSGPTTASRQSMITGKAVQLAVEALKERVLDYAATQFKTNPNQIVLDKTGAHYQSHWIKWQDIYLALKESPEGLSADAEYIAPVTHRLEDGGAIHLAYGFSAQAMKVLVHPETGEVKVADAIVATDAGRVLNPLGLQAQIEGGVVMGISHALMEELLIEEGIVKTERIAQYRVPRFVDSPHISSLVVEAPTSQGPYGAKGIGELVCVPTSPAIANAIYNATGFRAYSLPIKAKQIQAWFAQNAPDTQ